MTALLNKPSSSLRISLVPPQPQRALLHLSPARVGPLTTPQAAPGKALPAPAQRRTRAAAAASAGAASTSVGPVDDFASDPRPVILYDGVCNLCNGAVNLMLDLDPQGSFRLAALQSEAGRRLLRTCGRAPDDISSIVLVEQAGRHYVKSEAVLRIASGLANPFPLLAWFGFPLPLFARDVLYDLVADNRYSLLGKRDVCRLSDERFTERFIAV